MLGDCIDVLDTIDHTDGVHQTVVFLNSAGNVASTIVRIEHTDESSYSDDIPF